MNDACVLLQLLLTFFFLSLVNCLLICLFYNPQKLFFNTNNEQYSEKIQLPSIMSSREYEKK